MKNFVALLVLAIAVAQGGGSPSPQMSPVHQNQPLPTPEQKLRANWDMLRPHLPESYFRAISNTKELSENPEFQTDIFKKVFQGFSAELDTVRAKQNFLSELAKSACEPVNGCPKKSEPNDRVKRQFFFPNFNFPFLPAPAPAPVTDMTNYFPALNDIKTNLDNLLLRNGQLAERIFGSCPNTKTHTEKVDPEMLEIVRGKRDGALKDVYWQGTYGNNPYFPQLVPNNVFAPLQAVWNNLLNGFYGIFNQPVGWMPNYVAPVGFFGPAQFPVPNFPVPNFQIPTPSIVTQNQTFSQGGVNGTVVTFGGEGKPSGTVVTGTFGDGQNGGGVFTSQRVSSNGGQSFTSTFSSGGTGFQAPPGGVSGVSSGVATGAVSTVGLSGVVKGVKAGNFPIVASGVNSGVAIGGTAGPAQIVSSGERLGVAAAPTGGIAQTITSGVASGVTSGVTTGTAPLVAAATRGGAVVDVKA